MSFNLNSAHILKSTDMESYKNLLLLLIPPLIGILIFRLLRSPQVIRVEARPTSLQVPELFGLGISELVNDLEKRGIKRLRHETLGMLLRKCSEVGVPKELIENLISNYYELRFSQHTSEEKKKTLRAASLGVRKLL